MVAIKLVKKLEAEIVRGAILKDGHRIDGRNTKQIRPIEAMVRFLPRTHGSALFTRGETQAICTTTRSEEHTSELQSLMRISYAAFCLKKTIKGKRTSRTHTYNSPISQHN